MKTWEELSSREKQTQIILYILGWSYVHNDDLSLDDAIVALSNCQFDRNGQLITE